MKKIVGFSFWTNSEQRGMFTIHYTDDENHPDFNGLSTGFIVIPSSFVNIDTLDGEIHVDDTFEIVPKISRKGKLYKSVRISD